MNTPDFFDQEVVRIDKKDFGEHKTMIFKKGQQSKIRLYGDVVKAKQLWIDPKRTGKGFPIYVPASSDFTEDDLSKASIREDGKASTPKTCGVYAVYDYTEKMAKVLPVPFGGKLFLAIQENKRNEDWGDPTEYDMTVNIQGTGGAQVVTAVPSPKKALSPEVKAELDKVLVEQAVFGVPQGMDAAQAVFEAKAKEEVSIEDVPF